MGVLEFVPNKSLGPFKLGEKFISELCEIEFEFSPCENDDATEWDEYEFQSISVCVYTCKKGIIESISAEEKFTFLDKQIIGMEFIKFLNLVNIKFVDTPDTVNMVDDKIQNVYELDELGQQVWCLEGVIVKVFL